MSFKKPPRLPCPLPVFHQSRSVCSSTTYQPVFYRNIIRIPKTRRVFPLWKHEIVGRTIFPKEEKPAKKREKCKRIPGWDLLFRTLENSKDVRYREMRLKRKAQRRLLKGYKDPNEVLGIISDIITKIKDLSPNQQTEAIQELCLSTIDHFKDPSKSPRHHYALLPQAISHIIKGCSSLDRLDVAEMVLGQYIEDVENIIQSGPEEAEMALSPNPFNTLIEAASHKGNDEICQSILAEMHRVGISPTARTYNILIRSLDPTKTTDALQILQLMTTSSLRPTLSTLNTLLDFCFTSGQTQQISEVFSLLFSLYPLKPGSRTGPNATTASILLRQCKSHKDLEIVFADIQKWSLLRSPYIQYQLFKTLLRITPPEHALSRCLDWMNRYILLSIPIHPQTAPLIIQTYALANASASGFDFISRNHLSLSPHHPSFISLLRSIGRKSHQSRTDHREHTLIHQIYSTLHPKPSQKPFMELVSAMGRTGDVQGLWHFYSLLPSPTPSHHERFIKAFTTPLSNSPASALKLFSKSPTEQSFYSLLPLLTNTRPSSGVEFTNLLQAIFATSIQHNTAIKPSPLHTALSTLLSPTNIGQRPMAYSPMTHLTKIGVYDPSAPSPRPQEQMDLTREAVLRAFSVGVVEMAREVRQQKDVEGAVRCLEGWVENQKEREADDGVEGALRRLEVGVGSA